MSKQFKPFPADMVLAPTLARRLHQLREFRNLTVRDLSGLSRFSTQRIEDLEAGLESWLSSTDRQLLAKALSVEPALLKEVESRPVLTGPASPQQEVRLVESILQGGRDLQCPSCGDTLKCSVQDAYDLEGLPIRFAKAYCLKCPFVLR